MRRGPHPLACTTALLAVCAAAGASDAPFISMVGDGDGPSFGELTMDPTEYEMDISQDAMCRACYAGVMQLNKHLPASVHRMKKRVNKEVIIFDAMEEFCSEAHFFEHTGWPAEMAAACVAFLDEYNADSGVEAVLLRGGDVHAQCQEACGEVCEGVPGPKRFTSFRPEEEALGDTPTSFSTLEAGIGIGRGLGDSHPLAGALREERERAEARAAALKEEGADVAFSAVDGAPLVAASDPSSGDHRAGAAPPAGQPLPEQASEL